MSKMEGRGNLFLLFFCIHFQNFPILVTFGPPQILQCQIVFPEIGIFSSSWNCRKFCGKIEFDKKRLPFFGKNASSWKSWKTVGPRRKISADLAKISSRRRRQNFHFMEARTQRIFCVFLKFLLYYI